MAAARPGLAMTACCALASCDWPCWQHSDNYRASVTAVAAGSAAARGVFAKSIYVNSQFALGGHALDNLSGWCDTCAARDHDPSLYLIQDTGYARYTDPNTLYITGGMSGLAKGWQSSTARGHPASLPCPGADVMAVLAGLKSQPDQNWWPPGHPYGTRGTEGGGGAGG